MPKKNNLLKSIDLNLENSNSIENEYKEYIKGMIIFNGNEYKFNITTNSYSMGNKSSVLKAFKELEQLFYNVIE